MYPNLNVLYIRKWSPTITEFFISWSVMTANRISVQSCFSVNIQLSFFYRLEMIGIDEKWWENADFEGKQMTIQFY